jgi:aminopeptidase N
MYINIPIGNRAASNGLLMDTLQLGNTVTYHWRHRYPIANYLIAMAVTNYAAYEDIVTTQYGDVHVLNYCYPENKSDWQAASSNTAQALQLYSNLFGAYPFIKEKYGQAQFNWGGGMEHQTMSFIYATDFELVNHEMAHQWFGDKLTCGSWGDIWLNEGFATYLSGLCYQYLQPMWWWAFRNTSLGPIKAYGISGSVYCTDTNTSARIFSGALSYKKGAYLLHMLRWELGDSVFFAAIKSYVNDPALIYSFSKTQMLEQHLEAKSGKDLSGFFAKWFYGQGYPTYAMDWAQSGTKLSCRLTQSTSNPSVSFYELDVPVRFFGKGRDTTLVLNHSYSGQEYTFDVPFVIDSVSIDPELWLISGNNTSRKLPSLNSNDFIEIYPNPIADVMTIWYDSRDLNQLSYSIWDMQGKKVMDRTLANTDNDRYTASLAALGRGVYIIRINTDRGNMTQRIVKY